LGGIDPRFIHDPFSALGWKAEGTV